MKKHLILLASLMLLNACATIKTLDPNQKEVQIDSKYRDQATYCYEITRIYSGFYYHMCSHPLFATREVKDTDFFYLYRYPFALVDWDTVFSFAADTVVLPMTVVTQITRGNIKIAGKDRIINLNEKPNPELIIDESVGPQS